MGQASKYVTLLNVMEHKHPRLIVNSMLENVCVPYILTPNVNSTCTVYCLNLIYISCSQELQAFLGDVFFKPIFSLFCILRILLKQK